LHLVFFSLFHVPFGHFESTDLTEMNVICDVLWKLSNDILIIKDSGEPNYLKLWWTAWIILDFYFCLFLSLSLSSPLLLFLSRDECKCAVANLFVGRACEEIKRELVTDDGFSNVPNGTFAEDNTNLSLTLRKVRDGLR